MIKFRLLISVTILAFALLFIAKVTSAEDLATTTSSGNIDNTYSSTTDGNGNLTSTSTTTLISDADTTPPTPPSFLYATEIGTNGFRLNWTASIDPYVSGQYNSGAIKYLVYKNDGSTHIGYTTATNFLVTDLPSGSRNYFSVAAIDGRQNISQRSISLLVTTLEAPLSLATETRSTTTLTNTTTQTTQTTTNTNTDTTLQITEPILKELYIEPSSVTIYTGESALFRAFSSQSTSISPVWSVLESGGGSINSYGIYTAPHTAGTYHVIARASGFIEKKATVTVREAYIEPIKTQTETSAINNTTSEPVQSVTEAQKAATETKTNTVASPAPSEDTSSLFINPTTTRRLTVVAPSTTTLAIQKYPTLASSIDALDKTIEDGRTALSSFLDMQIVSVLADRNIIVSREELEAIKTEILKEYDDAFANKAGLSTDISENLLKSIEEKFADLSSSQITSSTDIANSLSLLESAIAEKSDAVAKSGGDLLYKDTNQDGISDYESLYLYGIDPIIPSPTADYEGKTITAGEKVLLGFDPAAEQLIKIVPEEPEFSALPPIDEYHVSEVSLTNDKQLLLKGKALPNSIITIYVYSTPIIVTVKADERGEWQYVLDKEIEDGDHIVYTASVSNSGKIVAKSSGFPFIKTAEAASLLDKSGNIAKEIKKPGVFEGFNIYIILLVFVGIIALSIILLAIVGKKSDETIPPVN